MSCLQATRSLSLLESLLLWQAKLPTQTSRPSTHSLHYPLSAQCSVPAHFHTCPEMLRINPGCQPASTTQGQNPELCCTTWLTGLEGVTVVRQRPTSATKYRHDFALDTALVDIELLSAASHLIGPNLNPANQILNPTQPSTLFSNCPQPCSPTAKPPNLRP